MKAAALAYQRARSLEHACELLAAHGDEARLLAGGQSLMPALNMRLATPALLIDLNGLDALAGIELRENVVRIGALTRHRALERSPVVARHLPLIARAMPHVAHAAVRNRGTLGGSLALADPAAELPACCLALDAVIVARSLAGERRMPARSFFRDLYETALAPDEIITAVEFPVSPAERATAFIELARRHGDYAMVGAAAVGRLEADRWHDLSIAFLGAGRTPRLAVHAANVLLAQPWSQKALAGAQEALALDLEPLDDVWTSATTRAHLARVVLARVLSALPTPRA